MTKSYLEKNYSVSSYNEGTCEQIDYYINENTCEYNDVAYRYLHENDKVEAMKIIHVIKRSNNFDEYDKLLENDDVLLDGEDDYDADTSAEFITDNDCYLIWFKYI